MADNFPGLLGLGWELGYLIGRRVIFSIQRRIWIIIRRGNIGLDFLKGRVKGGIRIVP